MSITIRKYNESKDYTELVTLLKSEGEEWKEYLKPSYQKVLETSITFVAYIDEQLCGYARSIDDSGVFSWVIDLLVDKEYRGQSIGHALLKTIKKEFPDQDVYVLSDVDTYYEKLGYTKVGSIFEIK